MSEDDYAVLAHEYIHFLQDISTTYGAFMAYSSSEYMRSVAAAIRNSEDGIIDVPFIPEIDAKGQTHLNIFWMTRFTSS